MKIPNLSKIINFYDLLYCIILKFILFRVFNLLVIQQNDRQMVSQLEKRLSDEKRQRLLCESQLVSEKRQLKKVEELAASRLAALTIK